MTKNDNILNKNTALSYLAQRLDCTVDSLSFLFANSNEARPAVNDIAIPDERLGAQLGER